MTKIKSDIPHGAEIVVGTLFTPKYNQIGKFASCSLRAYANRHGYGSMIASDRLDNHRPASWSKLRLAERCFQENPSAKWFAWFDADVAIARPEMSLVAVIDEAVDFVIGDDLDPSPLNCGVFLLRNCQASLDFIRHTYSKTKFINHPWWEQLAVAESVWELTGAFRTKIVPRRTMNSFASEYQTGDFAIHFVGGDRETKLAGMKKALRLAYGSSLDACTQSCVHAKGKLPNGNAACTHRLVRHGGGGVPLVICGRCPYRDVMDLGTPSMAPCANLGERIKEEDGSDKKIACDSCKGRVMLFVHECKVHGECTLSDCRSKGCYTHKAILEDCMQSHPGLSVPDMVRLIKTAPPGPWPLRRGKDGEAVYEYSWHLWGNTRQAMRQLADEFIETLPTLRDETYPIDRGIVIVGGIKPVPHLPWGYLPCIWVTIAKIRMLGCTLPIQLWYLGHEDMDEDTEQLLSDRFGVECVNGYAQRWPARILNGWEMKLYATLHSPFRETLFLDADNSPINVNPEEYFEQPSYRECGAMFWPDHPGADLPASMLYLFGIAPAKETAFQGGQILIDKDRCWEPMRLALWYAEYSDYVFQYVYGDKDCPNLAWKRLGVKFAMPKLVDHWWTDIAMVQGDETGRRIMVHRFADKWRLDGKNRFVAELDDEQLHHNLIKELKDVWKKS